MKYITGIIVVLVICGAVYGFFSFIQDKYNESNSIQTEQVFVPFDRFSEGF